MTETSGLNAFGRRIHPCQPWVAGEPCEVFHGALRSVISVLHEDPARVPETVDRISGEIRECYGRGTGVLERRLKELLSAEIPDCRHSIDDQLATRTGLILDQISNYLPSEHTTIVDWGCGNGAVGTQVSLAHPTFLVDIKDHRTTGFDLPFLIYDEENPIASLPINIGVLLLLTVLHHARDPIRTLQHSLVTAPRRIIVIESVPDLPENFFDSCPTRSDDLPFEYCAFVDWFYNRVICTGVQMTYNYQFVKDWVKTFQTFGYSLVEHVPLGIDQPLVPESHVLLVFEQGDM